VKENQKDKTDKNLHPERYDKSLFKRAYKAGMELRELKEQETKRRIIIQNVLLGLSFLLVICGIYYFLNNKPLPYTSPIVWDIEENFLVKPPTKIHGVEDINLEITAKSAIAFNPDSGEIFLVKDIDSKRQIASLTKIMTSIIVMDNMKQEDIITVGEVPTYGENEIWSIELEKGDQVTVKNLLNMVLISSYNDAAIILSESIGSQAFLSLMNEKVTVLGLQNTAFSNPCGFDNQENYSTVRDLYNIVRVFLEYPTLTEMVNSLAAKVEYVRGEETITKTIFTTNSLLEDINVKGIKTGYTEDAGACLITLFEYDHENRLVVILLDSEERYEETELIEARVRDLIDHL